MKTLIIYACLSMLVAINASADINHQEESVSVHGIERIEIGEESRGGLVSLGGSIRTRIIVSSTGGDAIRVFLKDEVEAVRRSNRASFEIDRSGDTLRIDLDKGSGVRFFAIRRNELTLEVQIPKLYNRALAIEVSSARVNIDNFELSQIMAHASSGDLDIGEIKAGIVDIRTSSGDVALQVAYARELYLHTSSGRIEGGALEAENVEIAARSGDIGIGSIFGTGSVLTTSGGILVAKSAGSLNLKASSGDIRLLEAAGTYNVEISSGELELDFKGNRGEATVRSSSGGITVRDIDGTAALDSKSGDIEAVFGALQGDSKIETSSGAIIVELPGNTDFNLDARTASGRIRGDFPVTVTGEIKEDRLSGIVGRGGPALNVKTSSGDIEIRSR